MADPLEFTARADGNPPLVEGHEPEARHRVQGHDRLLPPKATPVDPDQIAFELDDPKVEPHPRRIPVRPHVRRNPRRQKETPMTPDTPLPGGEAHARSTDPTTSHVAATTVDVTRSQAIVLDAFRRDTRPEGIADFELERMLAAERISPSRIRSARSELQAAGLVEPTGERRLSPFGRPADVHVLTAAGRTIPLPPVVETRTD